MRWSGHGARSEEGNTFGIEGIACSAKGRSADGAGWADLRRNATVAASARRAMTDRHYTALVLAASRGNLDPLARAGGVSHKTFIDVAGTPMLERVVRSVVESGRVGRVVISIEQESDEAA